jgi:ureidoacrylate peracid hydrolase
LRKTFEYGTWGGELGSELEPQPGDVVAQEHWCSSGFANTDLDLLLKKHGIHKLIVVGLIAHTCVEATVRFAAEFGYEVTMAKDATADYSDEEMHAALDINIPNYATAVVTTTDDVVQAISSPGCTGTTPAGSCTASTPASGSRSRVLRSPSDRTAHRSHVTRRA